jgi:prepilin peptidase CpaA
MGAGDVKLVAAIGSLVGPHELLLAMFLTALCGGLCALVMMVANWGLRDTLRWGFDHVRSVMLTRQMVVPVAHARPRLSLRYAPIVAVGTVIAQVVQRGYWSL